METKKQNKKTETIRNVWAIVAQSSSVDLDRNSLSLFDIVEEISFQIPGILPENAVFPINLQLVSLWERDEIGTDTELKVKTILKDPKNKILVGVEGLIKMKPQHKRFRYRNQFQGMPITGSGAYKYEILSLEPDKTGGKELLASAGIEVKIVNQPIKSPLSL